MRHVLTFFLLLAGFVLAGCNAPQAAQPEIEITIIADGVETALTLPAGSTVENALQNSRITLGDKDRIQPPVYTVLEEQDQIEVVRVQEVFDIETQTIPFDEQVIRNESLPEGSTQLLQAGVNGIREITFQRNIENGIEVKRVKIKETTLQEPQPQIRMVGVQSPFAPLPLPGKIVFITGGNAWLMEGTTANRQLIVNTGDLDGRIFSASPNGKWLVFTRKSQKPAAEEINTLWAVSLTGSPAKPFALNISNVVHFADWAPHNSNTLYYSTVEPRAAAPGWQANNDLFSVVVGAGWAGTPKEVIEANSGGIYGWWGTNYVWSPKGQLAYTRPDGIGRVRLEENNKGTLEPILNITPLQTRADWAWIPGLAWGPDGRTIFVVDHAPSSGLVSPDESPFFDLSGVSIVNETSATLIPRTGMFAYPAASPLWADGFENGYRVAYLQAIFPTQSRTSRYRLHLMDRDGSNAQAIFPAADKPGMEPHQPVWSPEPLASGNFFLAVIYQNNLYMIDAVTYQVYQITGDGLISRIDWK